MVAALSCAWVALVIARATPRRPLAAARLEVLGLRPPARPRPAFGRRRLAARAAPVLVATALHPLIGASVAAALALRPWLVRRGEAQRYAMALETGVADAVALLALAVGAGHNLVGALDAAARHTCGPMGDELAHVVAEARRGRRLADALDALADRVGDAVRPLTSALVSCERYGAPIGTTLERLGADVRLASRQRAEAAARRVPVRLLFPLVTCILPAFGLLTVAPLIAGSLQELGL